MLIEKTIGQYLNENGDNLKDKEAIVFVERKIRHSWKTLKETVDKTAKGFMALGIKKNTHVAIWGTNIPEWLYTELAVGKIGAVLITINQEFKDPKEELGYILKQSDAEVLILQESFQKITKGKTFNYDYLGILKKLCPELECCQPGLLNSPEAPKLKTIILISDQKEIKGTFSWNEIVAKNVSVSDEDLAEREKSVKPDDIFLIQYTSGTTGFPKGAMLTHNNVLAYNAVPSAANMRLTYKDRLCGPVPFFHCFGSILVILCCLVTGATIVIPADYFQPIKTLEAIAKEKCTALHGVPAMFIAQLKHPDFNKFDLTSLRTGIIAGAACPVDLMQDIIYKMHCGEITIVYGQTEASPTTHQTRPEDSIEDRCSTVGKPIQYVKAKVVDPETKQECPCNVVGEIWVRGPNVMKGYYNKPEVTAKTITSDGWLKTGDRGLKDERGYYQIRGRIKNMIIVGGENVDEFEVERFLFNALQKIYPGAIEVGGVQAIGVPHEELGEVVAVCVKLEEGKTLSEAEIKNIYYETKENGAKESKIAIYKIPRYIKFVDSFPLTAANKVNKEALKQALIKELGLEELSKRKTA